MSKEQESSISSTENLIEPQVRLDSPNENKIVEYSSLHVGPLPSPEAFAQYEQTCKGAANRILLMAETEASERHKANNKALDATVKDTKRGMYMAFWLAMLLIIGGFFLLLFDHYVTGTLFSVSGLSVVITAFVGKKESDKNVNTDNN